jgi:oxygen-dependent protoporphyrinogen oxidase
MVYGGGDRGRRYLDRTDDEMRDDFLADLFTIYPQMRGRVAETMVSRWQHAGPYAAPGRWRAQAALEAGVADRIFFAGDWVSDFVSMETAARTAVDAATAARRAAGVLAAAN